MRGIIILDGSDGAGKTTLANAIKERVETMGHKAIVCHQGKPAPGTCWDTHSSALLDYIEEAFTKNTVVIGDRHFLSESIYGRVYRTGSEYPFGARHVDRLLERFRALRVVCAPSVKYITTTHARLKNERVEEYDSGMNKIALAYLDLWNGALVKSGTADEYSKDTNDYLVQLMVNGGAADRNGWCHYDVETHGQDLKTYVAYLLHELNEQQSLIPENLLDPTLWHFTGFPHDQAVLLVGDRVSAENRFNIPFYSNKGSSLYLAKTLHKLNADEARIVIANVNDPDGLETVSDLAAMCGRVVVLGREAERAMQKQGIKYHARIRHPQHARRFSFHDNAYMVELGAALDGWAGVQLVYKR